MKSSRTKDFYQTVTDKMIEMIENNPSDWLQPWKGGQKGAPMNLVSKKPYRGVNALLLGLATAIKYDQSAYVTYRQARELGGQIRKGQTGWPVLFWKILNVEKTRNDTGENELLELPLGRIYYVFNIDQCDGLDDYKEKDENLKQIDFDPIEECESILKSYQSRPEIKHQGQRACYFPKEDYINMPQRDSFSSSEMYYSVLFHEMGHSTGHQSRLSREGIVNNTYFGDTDYSKEELVAEMTACFLCGTAGIEKKTFENSASYIKGWLSALKTDKKMLITAGGQAQRATDYILHNRGGE